MQVVFISYSTEDLDFVEREIVHTLRSGGLEPWFATRSIGPPHDFERKIRDALEKADWFLVVMSPRSAASEWVRFEVHWAMDHRRPINRLIPVLMEDCERLSFHLGLPGLQYVDYRSNPREAGGKLLACFGLSPCDGRRVLVVDTPDWEERLTGEVKRAMPGARVQFMAHYGTAVKALREEHWDLLVTDIAIPPHRAQKLGRWLVREARNREVPSVVVYGTTPRVSLQDVRNLLVKDGARDVFSKSDFADNEFQDRLCQIVSPVPGVGAPPGPSSHTALR